MSAVKVSIPHMGNYAVAFKSMVEGLGCEMVFPPPVTRRTIELGSRHSPEFVCLPFKINLGNFMEALEEGAEVLLQAGRSGACRYGFYGEVQEQILKDLGYKFRMVSLFSGGKQFNFISSIKSLANGVSAFQILRGGLMTLLKIRFIDEMESKVRRLRAYEVEGGASDRLFKEGLRKLSRVRTQGEVTLLRREMQEKFASVEIHKDVNPIRIGIVGELYVVMEPYANLDIERKLGSMGVEVIRPMCLSALLKYAVLPFLSRGITREGRDFIHYELGAHAAHSVGHTVKFAREGLDGAIQLYPFTCMPEVSARAILGNVSRTLGIPVLHFSFSEQTGEAGVDTRIEAFVDMLERKRAKQ
jgi:predicted nucleotide-binding protein (sugar kinase/HSP70/actin superfamily)